MQHESRRLRKRWVSPSGFVTAVLTILWAGTVWAQEQSLQQKVDLAIDSARLRRLTAGVHNCWQIMHGVIAFGKDFKVLEGPERKPVEAIDYICTRENVGGRRIFVADGYGVDILRNGLAAPLQGHEDQFLSILALDDVPPDQPIVTDAGQHSVGDLVKEAQSRVRVGQELTFTLMALGHYLPLDASWTNREGQAWNIEYLTTLEARINLTSAACGGTHSLTALSRVLKRRDTAGLPRTELWKTVAERLAYYKNLAQSWQNPDGSFSSYFFASAGASGDVEQRLDSSGHTLEWLAYELPTHELAQPWMERGADYVAGLLNANRERPLGPGALYHAAHGLVLYRGKRWGTPPEPAKDVAAAKPAG